MARSLRVLVWFWGRRGGGARYTHELAKVLGESNDVDLYLSLSRQSDYFEKSSELKARARFDIDTYSNIPSFMLRGLWLPLVRRRFLCFLREHKIDVVLCSMDHLWNAYMASAIHDASALYMLTVHDASRHPGENQPWRQWLLTRDISLSDGALVLTRSVGQALQMKYKYPKERIFESVHGHFGDYVRETPRSLPVDRPVRLLFFGRIIFYKGLDILLDALALLRRKYPDVTLEIWGDGDLASYQNQLDQLDGIRLVNRWISEAEIPSIFENTDLLMLPYREASQSGVVAIGQAYGMPSIATPISGLCEQVQHEVTGIVVSEVDAASLADGIQLLIEHPERYARLSHGCLETARTELSWKRIGKDVSDALEVLHKKGRRSRRN